LEKKVILQGVWDLFSSQVFNDGCASSLEEGIFNPYTNAIPGLEHPQAHRIRQDNLRAYLESFRRPPRMLIIGESPGWRGCRFSGVPFTSEAQLQSDTLPFQGHSTSLRSRPYSEATATIFWKVMAAYHPLFLAWNSVPLHYHLPGEPLSNRCPSKNEIGRLLPILARLNSLLQPELVIAVGRSAQWALDKIGVPTLRCRHPSHGGAAAFKRCILNIIEHNLEKTSAPPSGIHP